MSATFSGNVVHSSYTVLLGTMHVMKYLSCDGYVSVRACPPPPPPRLTGTVCVSLVTAHAQPGKWSGS